jgi:hypothetical protein
VRPPPTNLALRRFAPVLAVLGILAVLWLAATLSSPQLSQLPLPEITTQPQEPGSDSTVEASIPPATDPAAEPGDAQTAVALPGWVRVLAVAFVVVLLATLGGVLIWVLMRHLRVRRRLVVAQEEPAPLAARDEEQEVLDAVDAGIEQLSDAQADPRRAVIECWVRLERAAAAAGTPRHVGDSPTELVSRLLHAHRVSRPALDGLAAVYREARYATHTVDERDRAAAVTALRQLRAELGAELRAELRAELGSQMHGDAREVGRGG